MLRKDFSTLNLTFKKKSIVSLPCYVIHRKSPQIRTFSFLILGFQNKVALFKHTVKIIYCKTYCKKRLLRHKVIIQVLKTNMFAKLLEREQAQKVAHAGIAEVAPFAKREVKYSRTVDANDADQVMNEDLVTTSWTYSMCIL